MRPPLLLIAACLAITNPLAAKLPEPEAARIVSAIYRAEGGAKAKVPYGILSVRVSSKDEARRVCHRTVQNTHDRWVKAGKPGSFISFLGARYCPPSDDPVGHRNWVRNVSRLTK